MAERRMFAKTIIDSDAFLDMPLSTQALYFHLSMRADDDGFVNSPKKISKMVGASDDELKVLFAKKFIIGFESGVVVIKHWKIHNYIQKDRKKDTNYYEEMAILGTDKNNGYTLDTTCVQDADIGKDRLELGKDIVSLDIEPKKERAVGFKKPTLDELNNRILEMDYQVDAIKFFNYYESNGWKVGRNKMKSWSSALATWNSNNDTKQQSKQPMQTYKQKDEAHTRNVVNSYLDSGYSLRDSHNDNDIDVQEITYDR